MSKRYSVNPKPVTTFKPKIVKRQGTNKIEEIKNKRIGFEDLLSVNENKKKSNASSSKVSRTISEDPDTIFEMPKRSNSNQSYKKPR